MKIVFTICCNNYLAQALTLGDSVREHNPDVEFVIGLVDEPLQGVKTNKHKIIPVKKAVENEALAHMAGIYNITELCTAVKPHYFDFFFKSPDIEKVVYLDPDIIVFHNFDELFSLNDKHSIIVTPHFCTPHAVGDKFANDIRMLSGGIYNLGFIIISNNSKASVFLQWWKSKSLNQFLISVDFFTDQLWVNCVTCFCEDVLVLRNLGYNMANWNLHERQLTYRDNKYFVNDEVPLVFFHFSHYSPGRPHQITSLNKKILLSERPDVAPVFDLYLQRLKKNEFDYYKTIKPVYLKKSLKLLPDFLKSFIIRACVKTLLLLKHG